MSRRSRRGPVEAFPALPQGIQKGLQRLVGDHAGTISAMLDISDDDAEASLICEKCAQVMKQQQLSASSFLARFFQADMLSQHATEVLQKSGKGSAAALADRIAAEWAKNKLEASSAAVSPKEDKAKPKSSDKKKLKASQDSTEEKEKREENVTAGNVESKKRKSKEDKTVVEAVIMEKIPKKKKK